MSAKIVGLRTVTGRNRSGPVDRTGISGPDSPTALTGGPVRVYVCRIPILRDDDHFFFGRPPRMDDGGLGRIIHMTNTTYYIIH